MDLRTLIATNCANYSDGQCSNYPDTKKSKKYDGACIALNGERCDYLETAVIPILNWPDPLGHAGLRNSQKKAIESYLRTTNQGEDAKHTPE